MADAELRDLERTWQASGLVADEARLLRARLRRGELAAWKLELAAFYRHEPARVALGAATPAGAWGLRRWTSAIAGGGQAAVMTLIERELERYAAELEPELSPLVVEVRRSLADLRQGRTSGEAAIEHARQAGVRSDRALALATPAGGGDPSQRRLAELSGLLQELEIALQQPRQAAAERFDELAQDWLTIPARFARPLELGPPDHWRTASWVWPAALVPWALGPAHVWRWLRRDERWVRQEEMRYVRYLIDEGELTEGDLELLAASGHEVAALMTDRPAERRAGPWFQRVLERRRDLATLALRVYCAQAIGQVMVRRHGPLAELLEQLWLTLEQDPGDPVTPPVPPATAGLRSLVTRLRRALSPTSGGAGQSLLALLELLEALESDEPDLTLMKRRLRDVEPAAGEIVLKAAQDQVVRVLLG